MLGGNSNSVWNTELMMYCNDCEGWNEQQPNHTLRDGLTHQRWRLILL
jgi:hypothetical protein